MAGKAHAHARLSEVIDLTSDGENDHNELHLRNSSRRSGAKDDIQNDGFVTSNHGLPDPEEFMTTTTKLFSGVIDLTPNANGHRLSSYMLQSGAGTPRSGHQSKITHGPQLHLSPAGAGGVSAAPPILPTSTLENWRSTSFNNKQGNRAQGAGSSRTSQSPSIARILEAQQRSSEPGKQSSVPDHTFETPRHNGLPSLDYYDFDEQQEQEDFGVTYSPLNVTAQPSSMKRQKLDVTGGRIQKHPKVSRPTFHAQGSLTRTEPAPILPPSKTVITGANRAADSEIPRKSSPGRWIGRGTYQPNFRAHVLPHMDKILLDYRGSLSRWQATTLMDQMVISLLEEPKFKNHVNQNNGVMSPEFEQKFSQTLQTRFNKAARVQTDRNALQTAGRVVTSDVHSHVQEQSYPTPSSADSPDAEQVFEDSHVRKPSEMFTESRFRDDSSPATSLSGRAGSHNQSEDADEDTEPVAQKSGRVTRGAKVDYYVQDPLRQAKRTQSVAGPSRQMGGSSRISRSNQNSTKDIQTAGSSKRGHQVVTSHLEVPDNAIRPRPTFPPEAMLGSMLRQRERYGMVPVRARFGLTSYKTLATNALEDSMVRDWRWTSQSSDVVTITWTGDSTFVSGALAHYDVHNMQYNRHGNLVVGSTESRIVKMVDGHRTLRPIVTSEENKENSLPAMRATQDKWRYAPVVSTAYCQLNEYVFTGSFDKTVKVWKVSDDGKQMELKGTWEHDFRVNFVVTSEHHDRVATASEGQINAVRIYQFDDADISRSPYDDHYNAHRASTKPGDERMAENWAYHPATMQWGVAPSVAALLLVGYSPRGNSPVEDTVPDTKKNTGELCCWNAITGNKVPINAGHSQNVFEVLWHPTQPIFLVASSPSGTFDTKKTKTQVKLFQLQGTVNESFQCLKTLDCPASDINELTMRPTSIFGGYVTASCTDGKTYVWDTMLDDCVLHVLPHGESIDNPDPDLPLEQADTGVKFAAWGQSTNRFYTGSSDGVVKVWDITQPPDKIHVRDLLEAQGGISCGSFSSDHSQLLIGDGTGCIHLVQVPSDEEPDTAHKPGSLQYQLSLRKMGPIVPHDPEPPMSSNPADILDTCRDYIAAGILSKLPMDIPGFENRHRIGQGPKYDQLKLYNDGLHVNGDHSLPVLPDAGYASNWDTVREVKSQQVGSQEAKFPILRPVKSSLKRPQPGDKYEFNEYELMESVQSLRLRRDIEISAEHIQVYEKEENDYVPDE